MCSPSLPPCLRDRCYPSPSVNLKAALISLRQPMDSIYFLTCEGNNSVQDNYQNSFDGPFD